MQIDAEIKPELADIGRITKRLVTRTVAAARAEEQSVGRLLAGHLGSQAAALPVAKAIWPVYDRVNVQTGVNEMDGLGADMDVTFLLTTNRADLLEEALAARPGRVDHAVELPVPDADARARLIRLYQGNLELNVSDLPAVIARTEGVTASFIKELLRRAALEAAESDGQDADEHAPIRVTDAHLTAALDQLLDTRAALTQVLLGGAPNRHQADPT